MPNSVDVKITMTVASGLFRPYCYCSALSACISGLMSFGLGAYVLITAQIERLLRKVHRTSWDNFVNKMENDVNARQVPINIISEEQCNKHHTDVLYKHNNR